jgi:integrative and conjugative element protein (TIGR02256 family)
MIIGRPEVVKLSSMAAASVCQESTRALPYETGGVLVGFVEGTTACVTHTIGPGPRAIHRRTGFQRDGDYAQDQINQLYEQSGGKVDYLAEWHSHPKPIAPSPMDLQSMRDISQDEKYLRPEPLLLLAVQVRRSVWQFYAYQYRDGELTELSIQVEQEASK